MSGPLDSAFGLLAALAIVIVSAIGIHREGFAAAENATNSTDYANTTAGGLDAFLGSFVELLPLLVLVAAAVALVRTV